MPFDISTPLARAQLLARLRAHREEFTVGEQYSYDTLRDALMKVARGEDEGADLGELIESLAHFLEEPAVAEVPDTPKSVPLVRDASIVRIRRGPDTVSAPVVVPELPTLVQPQEVVSQEVSVAVPATPATVTTAPPLKVTRTSLQDQIEGINDGLNTFAHGTAFKWLSDLSTGYRTYLNELLLLRFALAESETGATVSDTDLQALRDRVQGLQHMADEVRRAVGGEEKQIWVTETAGVSSISTEPETGVAPGIPSPPNVEETSIDTQTPEMRTEIAEVQAATDASMHEVPEDMPEDMRETQQTTVPEAVLESSTMETTPAPLLEIGMEPAEGVMTGEQEGVLQPMELVPAEADLLQSKEIESGLNDLLVHWLGKTGFLGFGSSGVKHPSWLLMRELYVEDVLANDGVIPKGLPPEIYTNLAENIKAWKRSYALLENDAETVDHFVRRVVSASTLN